MIHLDLIQNLFHFISYTGRRTMAAGNSLQTLSNLDIIRLTKDFGRDEYYRLGGVLGFGEDILEHLWDPAQKGSALKVVLLWRDGLEPEVDQRGHPGGKALSSRAGR